MVQPIRANFFFVLSSEYVDRIGNCFLEAALFLSCLHRDGNHRVMRQIGHLVLRRDIPSTRVGIEVEDSILYLVFPLNSSVHNEKPVNKHHGMVSPAKWSES